MATYKDLPISAFSTRAAFEKWLAKNHDRAAGLWLKFAKKAAGIRSISYEDAREIAIAYGWIDGLKHAIDDSYYALRFTPRRAQSKWSMINRKIAEQLLANGTMHAAGRAQVAAAKRDGRWAAAYPSAKQMQIPKDFGKALSQNEAAKTFFAAIDRTNRYAILYRIHDAKRPATRKARIDKFIEMLSKGQRLY
jgi:uncharacterized protein YdeI (YjbR/CyaY-like superfamily)